MYMVKLDIDGNFVWVKTIGGIRDDEVLDLEIDHDGHLVMIGNFRETVDFDPGPNVFNMTAVNGSNSKHGFVLKLDLNGNFLWANKVAAIYEKVAIDDQNNIAIIGTYNGLVDFDPGVGISQLSSGSSGQAFALKLDLNGNYLWAGGHTGLPSDLNFDFQGNLYTIGEYIQTGDFDPGSGVVLETSNGGLDVYILKLDVNGNFVWVESIGGTSGEFAYSCELDTNGNIYMAGTFASSNLDFDNGSGTAIHSGSGIHNGFLLKLDSAGTFNWVKAFEGLGVITPSSIKLDTVKSIYIVGQLSNDNDLDPGPNVTTVTTNNGDNHIFAVKLDSLGNFQWALDFGNESNTNADNNNAFDLSIIGADSLLVAGRYEDTVDFNPGPAIFNLDPKNTFSPDLEGFCMKLIPCTADSGTVDTITACDAYTWIDGNTYTSSNTTATFDTINQNGCDSIVGLHLTILNAETRTDTRTECSGYTWINGTTYTASNNSDTYTIAGAATNGCDSIITLNLIIINVNTNVTQLDQLTLQANATGAVYQWLDCNNNFAPIQGQMNNIFTAATNGSYAVQVTSNGCTDTSGCTAITSVGLKNSDPFTGIAFFPNPTSGLVNIIIENAEDISIKLYNIPGQLILEAKNISTTNYQFNIEDEAGVYILEIESAGVVKQYRIVKE